MSGAWTASVPPVALTAFLAASRALGADPSLVLGGGGNCSLKTTFTDITGATVPLLLVKASGTDMANLTEDGLAGLRLDAVRALLPPVIVPDGVLRNELRCTMVDSFAPDPSVETLIHARLPQPVVLHSHADAILTMSNSITGPSQLRELAPDCVVIDYAMPGPDLVAAVDAAWNRDDAVGLIVLGHGLFTVGDTPEQALSRHLTVVRRVADALESWHRPPDAQPLAPVDSTTLARLRQLWCQLAGQALVVRHASDTQVSTFLADDTNLLAAAAGLMTPDHVTWTKRKPMIGTDFDAFEAAYTKYFQDNKARRGQALAPHDMAPRVLLDRHIGMLSAARTNTAAMTVETIYRHTMTAIETANDLFGGWKPADERHVFDLEYWDFQQAKATRREPTQPLAGQIALVTGAASGIGRGCAAVLLEAGAVVVGWDINANVATTFDSRNYLGLQVDVTDETAVAEALATQVNRFGGLDILVSSAGIFPTSANLGRLTMGEWRTTMSVNADSVMTLFGQSHPLLAAAYPYGRVVVIASKNVMAPGPGAAAYSASKSALTQLSRVAALEWASEGIRVNMLHPDAVFDTGLWTPDLLAARAEHYGMTVDAYKRRNLLHTEITSQRVGQLALALCLDAFEATTGAQITIDGGNERTI